MSYLVSVTYARCGDRDETLRHVNFAILGGVLLDVETSPDLEPYLDDPSVEEALADAKSERE